MISTAIIYKVHGEILDSCLHLIFMKTQAVMGTVAQRSTCPRHMAVRDKPGPLTYLPAFRGHGFPITKHVDSSDAASPGRGGVG